MANTKAIQLRNLLADDHSILTAPGIYDGLSAALAQRSGFEVGYVSGGAASVSVIGRPDLGIMTGSEMIDHVGRLQGATDVPLIVDIDTGYGNEINIRHTVERLAQRGVAAVQIEDQTFPKRCGHLHGKDVVSRADAVSRVHAASKARGADEMLIIARTDAIAPQGLDEAITRAHLYIDAGADIIFVEAPESLEDVRTIAAEVPAPLMINVIASGRTPVLSASEYAELGYKIAIYPALTIAAAMGAIDHALTELHLHGKPPAAASPKDLFNAVGLDDWLSWADAEVSELEQARVSPLAN